jgi:hypothetical protein
LRTRRRIPSSGSLRRDSRAWITAPTRGAGVLSVRAWITSPRTWGSGIPGQLEQPRPHPVDVGPDMAGAQVPARELANPASPAPGQLKESVESILGCAAGLGRQADPHLPRDPAEPSHRLADNAGRGRGRGIISPVSRAFGPSLPERAGRRNHTGMSAGQPGLKVRNGMRGQRAHERPFASEHSLRRAIVALRRRAHYRADRRLFARAPEHSGCSP